MPKECYPHDYVSKKYIVVDLFQFWSWRMSHNAKPDTAIVPRLNPAIRATLLSISTSTVLDQQLLLTLHQLFYRLCQLAARIRFAYS